MRQAGFEIVYGADKDRAAVETFAANHPRAVVEQRDVSEMSGDDLPEFDVLVGGPPCIEFSMSKGNRRDVLAGLKLVQAFLRIVYERQPLYWIMENVPRVVLHMPDEIPLSWIGVPKAGYLEVPRREEFNCADFGVPQARRRFLMGDYPLPQPTHTNEPRDLLSGTEALPSWRTLGDVLSALPDPDYRGRDDALIRDPNYVLSLPLRALTDQFHDVGMHDEDVRRIRRAKQDHPYMGRMEFPDRVDRPSRTVVATQLGRETLVVKDRSDKGSGFRRVTVREAACLQAFPITYQFCGNSHGARYRIAGDAVPPPLTFAIGQRILVQEGLPAPEVPIVSAEVVSPSPPPTRSTGKRRSRSYRRDRRFSELVPGKEVRGSRAELDNQGTEPGHVPLVTKGGRHLVEWRAMLYVGEGSKALRTKRYDTGTAIALLARHAESWDRLRDFLEDLRSEIGASVPDASTLQAVWTEQLKGPPSPLVLIDRAAEVINEHFPQTEYHRVMVLPEQGDPVIPPKGLRIRIAAGLVAASYIAHLANQGLSWPAANPEMRYLEPGWGAADTPGTHPPARDLAELIPALDRRQRVNRAGGLF